MAAEGDRSSKRYLAVLAHRGGGGSTCPKEEETSAGAGSEEMGCPVLSDSVPSCPEPAPKTVKGQVGTKRDKLGQVNPADTLPHKGSQSLGQPDSSIFTREDSDSRDERSPEELEQLMQEATNFWG